MKTVSSKEFRSNLSSILARVNAGEEVIITHRFHRPVILKNAEPQKSKPNSKKLPGVTAYLKAPKKSFKIDATKSTKDLYHEMLDKQYDI